jgi:hypothetical protein
VGRRVLPEARERRRLKRKGERDAEQRKFIEQFGVHPSGATESKIAVAQRISKRRRRMLEEAQGAFVSLLAQAKILSIDTATFEYCNLTVVSKEDLGRFNKALREELAQFKDAQQPESVVDDHIRDFMQGWIDRGELVPAPTRFGTVPKARRYSNGKVAMLRPGEPDTDFLMENLKDRRSL